MSELATPSQLMTVALGWREPNGQVVQFGEGGGSAVSVAPAAGSSGASSSGSSEHGSEGGSAHSANLVDLLA